MNVYPSPTGLPPLARGAQDLLRIVVPAADAEAADALKRGDEWAVEGVVAEWARLPDRPVVRAEPRGGQAR
ncbi:MAG: hypothetical protein RLN75_05860 [Longimicrobiales bacterium]